MHATHYIDMSRILNVMDSKTGLQEGRSSQRGLESSDGSEFGGESSLSMVGRKRSTMSGATESLRLPLVMTVVPSQGWW